MVISIVVLVISKSAFGTLMSFPILMMVLNTTTYLILRRKFDESKSLWTMMLCLRISYVMQAFILLSSIVLFVCVEVGVSIEDLEYFTHISSKKTILALSFTSLTLNIFSMVLSRKLREKVNGKLSTLYEKSNIRVFKNIKSS